jgi:hypothetical protein
MQEELKELRERVTAGTSMAPYGKRILTALANNEKKVIRKFSIAESFSTVEFII